MTRICDMIFGVIEVTFPFTATGSEMTMTRMTAKDFSPELLELYDFYAHGRITKREFLDRAGSYTVGGLTATAIWG